MEGRPACDRAVVGLRHRESGSRDDAVREEAVAGLRLAHIQQATGLGTTTIMRGREQEPGGITGLCMRILSNPARHP